MHHEPVLQVKLSSMFESVKETVNRFTGAKEHKLAPMRLCPDFAGDNKLLLYTPGGRTVQLVDFEKGLSFKVLQPQTKLP